MKYLLYAVAGLFSGVIGGMGMGGGTILIPALTLFGGVSQHTAQAVNLVAFIPMAAVALFFHIKNKLVDTDGLLYMILPGAAFSACYAYIASFVSGETLGRVFGGFLILLSVLQFFTDKLVKTRVK